MQKQAASKYTHETVPTQFAEADGARYAFRRFGKAGTVPLLFLGYFNSNMDAWDPGLTNALAADHEVIAAQVKGFEREGHQRQEPAMKTFQGIQEGSVYVSRSDRRRHTLGIVE